MNISENTIKFLDSNYNYQFYDDNINDVEPSKATELHIAWELNTNEPALISKSIKTPKVKEVTIEYILNKLNADYVYKSFANHFNKVVNKFGFNAYPTTYGIGVFVAVGFRSDIDETKAKIESFLNEYGIIYTTEYSDAHWVFRFKISKSVKNIEIIEKIIS